VIANSNFRDRAKLPDYVNDIRVIVSYEESVEVAQVEKEAEEVFPASFIEFTSIRPLDQMRKMTVTTMKTKIWKRLNK
jgi:hypothetical protein